MNNEYDKCIARVCLITTSIAILSIWFQYDIASLVPLVVLDGYYRQPIRDISCTNLGNLPWIWTSNNILAHFEATLLRPDTHLKMHHGTSPRFRVLLSGIIYCFLSQLCLQSSMTRFWSCTNRPMKNLCEFLCIQLTQSLKYLLQIFSTLTTVVLSSWTKQDS